MYSHMRMSWRGLLLITWMCTSQLGPCISAVIKVAKDLVDMGLAALFGALGMGHINTLEDFLGMLLDKGQDLADKINEVANSVDDAENILAFGANFDVQSDGDGTSLELGAYATLFGATAKFNLELKSGITLDSIIKRIGDEIVKAAIVVVAFVEDTIGAIEKEIDNLLDKGT